ncbi:hypothetical protein R4B61_03365 [Fructilactobacillus vespulae]|uniref:hypothetical protein n=1 Tax=Fructilactobacillus vespulae TaxID=1249630 RepID=UPI0039B3C8EC
MKAAILTSLCEAAIFFLIEYFLFTSKNVEKAFIFAVGFFVIKMIVQFIYLKFYKQTD